MNHDKGNRFAQVKEFNYGRIDILILIHIAPEEATEIGVCYSVENINNYLAQQILLVRFDEYDICYF